MRYRLVGRYQSCIRTGPVCAGSQWSDDVRRLVPMRPDLLNSQLGGILSSAPTAYQRTLLNELMMLYLIISSSSIS